MLRKCYLGKVKANAMVTNPGYPEENINAFINLFKYAQQFYGQRNSDEFSFSMFYSGLPYSDLIFQDAAQKLIELRPGKIHQEIKNVSQQIFSEEREYKTYLGREFVKAFEEVECAYVGGSENMGVSVLLVTIATFIVQVL